MIIYVVCRHRWKRGPHAAAASRTHVYKPNGADTLHNGSQENLSAVDLGTTNTNSFVLLPTAGSCSSTDRHNCVNDFGSFGKADKVC